MRPIQLFDPASSTYTYVLFDLATREALIIDPVDEQIERDLDTLREYGLKLVWTVETHAHADHITSAGKLAELTGARTAAPVGCGIGTAGVQLQHGDTLSFGEEVLKALHTPGHTEGSMSFVWRDHVFTGDTLLINGCGRTDFQSGSAQALFHSITQVNSPPQPISRKIAVPAASGRLSEKMVRSVIPAVATDHTMITGAQRCRPNKTDTCIAVAVPAIRAKTPAISNCFRTDFALPCSSKWYAPLIDSRNTVAKTSITKLVNRSAVLP